MKSINVGALEAKTQFTELLDQVSKGAEVTITKDERPVAKLVPFEKPTAEFQEIFKQIREFGQKHPLNPPGMPKLTYRDLIDGGRKE